MKKSIEFAAMIRCTNNVNIYKTKNVFNQMQIRKYKPENGLFYVTNQIINSIEKTSEKMNG